MEGLSLVRTPFVMTGFIVALLMLCRFSFPHFVLFNKDDYSCRTA